MSPQQLGSKPSEPADDIYALGATIYELLTGKPPFYGGDVSRLIRESVPPSMAERRKELGVEGVEPIPEAWQAVVAACLAKEPGRRPTDAKAVWAGLAENHQGTKDTKEEQAEGEGGASCPAPPPLSCPAQARAPRLASVVPRCGTRPELKPTPPSLERLGYSRPSLTGLAHPRPPPSCESGSSCPTIPSPAHRRWPAATGPTPHGVAAFQASRDDSAHSHPSQGEPQPVPG